MKFIRMNTNYMFGPSPVKSLLQPIQPHLVSAVRILEGLEFPVSGKLVSLYSSFSSRKPFGGK